MKKQNPNPYEKFMNAFGYDYIMRISIEELSELIKAICKYKRKSEDVDKPDKELVEALLDGIADVEICIEELAYMFDGFDRIEEIKQDKIQKGAIRADKYNLKKAEQEKLKK